MSIQSMSLFSCGISVLAHMFCSVVCTIHQVIYHEQQLPNSPEDCELEDQGSDMRQESLCYTIVITHSRANTRVRRKGKQEPNLSLFKK